VFSLSVADLQPFGSCSSLLKNTAAVDLKSPLRLFHFCGLRFGVCFTQITTKKWSLP